MKKIMSGLLLFLVLFSTSAFANESKQITLLESTELSSTKVANNSFSINITHDQFVKLLQKYDMIVASPEEVAKLGLTVNPDGANYDLNVSYAEMDKILKKLKKTSSQSYTFNTVVDTQPMAYEKTTTLRSSATTLGLGSNSRTVEASETILTGLSDCTLRTAVAISFTFKWENFPEEPYREYDHSITSYSQGSITQTDSGSYNRLVSSSSSTSKINSTRIKQTYSGIIDQYIPVGLFWAKVGSKTIDGNVYYNIP